MDANFTPTQNTYKDLGSFRFWCQKVLPAVYDDSLSYYELLCKVVDYLNKTMEDVETLHGDVTNLHTAYNELQSYVNNYFSSLDVQEEINNKLDNMASSGELYDIIRKYTDPIVNEQNDQINVLKVRMDTFASLPDGSTAGDAELTDIRVGYNGIVYPSAGDAVRAQVRELKGDLVTLDNTVNGTFGYPSNYNYWQDKTPLTKDGAIYDGVIAFTGGSQAIYALPVVEGETYAFLMWNENWTDATVVQPQNILQGAFISDTDLPTESNNAYSIVGSRTGALVSAQITVPTNAKWFIFALQQTADVSTLFWEKITEENPSISVPTNEMEVLKNGLEQRLSMLENPISKYNGKVWVAMGDSLTAENTLGAGIDNYTNYVSDELGIEMLNFGHAGSGYWRMHEEGNAFYQRAENLPNDFDVITIFGSFNDLGDDTNGVHGYKIIGTYTDTTEDTICGCMNILLDRIYEKNLKALVGIIAPTPWASPTDGMYHANKEVEDLYINAIKSVAERRSIPFLDLLHCSNMHPWDEAFRENYYLNADGVHPNSEGHKFFAAMIADFIKRILYV